MRQILILFVYSLFFTSTMAQNKQFTLDDLIPGGTTYKDMQPENRTFVFEKDNVVEKEGRDSSRGRTN